MKATKTAWAALAIGAAVIATPAGRPAAGYDDLLKLFQEWREFQRPRVVDGVPDYTAAAMARQRDGLRAFQQRLRALDSSGWSLPQRIDHRLVEAEMNGLEFDHRVLRPWARDPSYYALLYTSESDTPRREGPVHAGAVELWTYTFPLAAQRLAQLRRGIGAIPAILTQAKANLNEDVRDLWVMGIRAQKDQSAVLARLAADARPHHPDLAADAERARASVEDLISWLEARLPEKKGRAGVGVENYNWYMKNVHLVPYTWQEEVTLMERELERARAYTALEQHRNRGLLVQQPIADAAEYHNRFQQGVTEFMKFLRERDLMTIQPYMDRALRERQGAFIPPNRPRDFFTQIDYRDPRVMRCHGTHWFDRARQTAEPHPSPIRQSLLLYNIWDSRAEGLATAAEEMLAGAGLFDDRPRSRELIYILVANRAARGLAGLRVQSGDFTVEQARQFAHDHTPNGWLLLDGNTNWFEQRLYLQQPGYGTCYLTGKALIEALLQERAGELGAQFSLRRFFDEFHAAGMMPVSMIRWELTGRIDPRLARQ